jgi:hypothetical protein
LDDFLTIDAPDVDGNRTMALLTMIFTKLNVPLAKQTDLEEDDSEFTVAF